MTPEQVREIRRRHGAGEHFAALAKEFGLSKRAVSEIVSRHSWKNV